LRRRGTSITPEKFGFPPSPCLTPWSTMVPAGKLPLHCTISGPLLGSTPHSLALLQTPLLVHEPERMLNRKWPALVNNPQGSIEIGTPEENKSEGCNTPPCTHLPIPYTPMQKLVCIIPRAPSPPPHTLHSSCTPILQLDSRFVLQLANQYAIRDSSCNLMQD